MRTALVAGALAFTGILACPKAPPIVPTYKTSMQELQPYFASYLWIDENAVDENEITRVNICQGMNGLEFLATQGIERDEMKEASAFTLLTNTLPELNPIVIEYAHRASQANCPPNDVDCLRDSFHDILDDGRFEEMICKAEEEYNTYVTKLVRNDVPGTEADPELLYSIRNAQLQEQYGQTTEKPLGVFYLDVCH